MAIVVLAGKKGSGKDSAAEILIHRHKFKRVAMADTLKELCSQVFNIPLNNFHDVKLKEESFSEPLVIDYLDIDLIREWLNAQGIEISYEQREQMEILGHDKKVNNIRELLVFVGTDLIRNNIYPDIWLNLALDKIKKMDNNVVVTDARFANERKALKDLGGILCLINRPGVLNESTHESENSLGSESDYDVIMNNKTTLNAFQSEVSLWWTFKRDSVNSKY